MPTALLMNGNGAVLLGGAAGERVLEAYLVYVDALNPADASRLTGYIKHPSSLAAPSVPSVIVEKPLTSPQHRALCGEIHKNFPQRLASFPGGL